MSDDNIIQFPNRKEQLKTQKEKVADLEEAKHHYEYVAHQAIDDVVHTLAINGYNPLKQLSLVRDLGVIMNLMVAMMYRVDEKEHFLQDPMDEMHEVIKYVKEINDKKRDELFTDDD